MLQLPARLNTSLDTCLWLGARWSLLVLAKIAILMKEK